MVEFPRERFREVPTASLQEIYHNRSLKRELGRLGFDPAKAAVFLDPSGELELRTVDFHHRTVDRKLPEPVRVQTPSADRVYAHFDLKGVGFVSPGTHESKKEGIARGALAGAPEALVIPGSSETPWGYDVLGLFDERMVTAAVSWADRLSSKGFRGEAFAAVYRLKHVWIGGQQKTVKAFVKEEAKVLRTRAEERADPTERQALHDMADNLEKEFSPVLAVRCVRSVFRIRDLSDADPELARLMLEEAVANIQQEARILGEKITEIDLARPDGLAGYTNMMADWCGKNLGVLQREGLHHDYLHMGNISLAGEVVDLDSIGRTTQVRGGKTGFHEDLAKGWQLTNPGYKIPGVLAKDARDMVVSIKNLTKTLKSLGYSVDKGGLARTFMSAWQSSMGNTNPYGALGCSQEKLAMAVQSMVDEGIRDGKVLPRLSAY